MTPQDRARYVRTIRALSDESAAVQLLEAFERMVRIEEDEADATAELDSIESLPDWSWPTLMQWALAPDAPPDDRMSASDLVVLREAQLLGDIARAAEQSVRTADSGTTRRLAQTLSHAWMRLRGEALLALALSFEEPDA